MNQYCYIVSYKVETDAINEKLQSEIKSYGTWAKISGDTWALVTEKKAREIRDHLQQYIQNGRIFVIKSGLEAAWNNVECSNEWLKKNL